MEFTADREGYVVETFPDAKQPGQDTVTFHLSSASHIGLMK
jgi:hypothetical protein